MTYNSVNTGAEIDAVVNAIKALTIDGPLIEDGSGPGGIYLRFGNGTQICAHLLTAGSFLQIWTFSALFVSPPLVLVSNSIAGARMVAAANPTTTEVSTYAFTSSDLAVGSSRTALAIGRYK